MSPWWTSPASPPARRGATRLDHTGIDPSLTRRACCAMGCARFSTWPPRCTSRWPPTRARVFLMQFVANCRRSSWKWAVRANVPLNEEAIEAFDVLVANGVDEPRPTPRSRRCSAAPNKPNAWCANFATLENAWQAVSVTDGRRGAARTSAPRVADDHRRAEHQRSALRRPRAIRPGPGSGGGRARRNDAHTGNRGVFSSGSGITVYPRSGAPLSADTAAIATGAWLSRLAGSRVRVPVQEQDAAPRSKGYARQPRTAPCTGTRTRLPASRDSHAPVAITAASALNGSPLRGYTMIPPPELKRRELPACASLRRGRPPPDPTPARIGRGRRSADR